MKELYLQKKFVDRLSKLVLLPQEVNGVLIYCPISEKDLVVYMNLLGGGSSDSNTTSNSNQLRLFDAFLKQNPNYGFLEFHTHTEGTIRQYGSYYAQNLSDGDIATLRDNYSGNDSYRHLLVTPHVLRLYKMEGKNVVSIGYKQIPDIEDLEEQVRQSVIELQRRMGIPRLELSIN